MGLDQWIYARTKTWQLQNLTSRYTRSGFSELNGRRCERLALLDDGRVKIDMDGLIISVKQECLVECERDYIWTGEEEAEEGAREEEHMNIGYFRKHWEFHKWCKRLNIAKGGTGDPNSYYMDFKIRLTGEDLDQLENDINLYENGAYGIDSGNTCSTTRELIQKAKMMIDKGYNIYYESG